MNKLKQLKNLWLALAVVFAVTTIQTAEAGMSFRFYGNITGLGLAIAGTDVEELYADDQFPDEPDAIDFATSIPGLSGIIVDGSTGFWEWPQPFATGDSGLNEYGAVATGLFIAPVTGTYQFFLRADDGSAVYVTDAPLDLDDLKDEDNAPVPNGKETGCCGAFGKTGTVTEVFNIEAGSGKYLTQTWKEGGGGDFMQLGVSINGGPVSVLPLGHVQRYEYSDEAPAGDDLLIAGFGPNGVIDEFSIEVNEAQTASVYVEFDQELTSLDKIPSITWKVDGATIEGQKGSLLSFVPAADAGEEQVTRTVEVTVEGVGSASFEVLVNRDNDAPSLVSAQGSGNPKGIVVNFSELVDEASATDKANYSISGQDVTIESVEVVDGKSVVLKVSDFNTDQMTVTVKGVTDRALAKNELAESSAVVAITTNLLAYWPFNDADDAENAVDVSGGHIGEIRDAQYTEDEGGFSGESGDYGMDFGSDNGGQFILVADASFLNASAASNQMTVSFWQKNAATHNSSSYWMWSQGINGGGRGNQAHVPWGNQQIYHDTQGCCGGGTERINRDINQFEDFYEDFYFDWHHYTFIKNGDRKEIWVDGKLFHSGTNNEDFTADFVRLSIGSADNGGNSVGAIMDDFAVFSVGLTPDQVAGLADGGSPGDLAEPLSKPLELVTDLPDSPAGEELKPFSLSIEVTGGESFTIGYQWYRDGEALLNQNSNTISWTELPKSLDGAKYKVEAFNTDGTFNTIASKEVALTVNADTNPPEIASVSGSPLNNGVTIVFNEKVSADDVSAGKFTLTAIEGGTGTVRVNGATLAADQVTVSLETDVQDSKVRYEVKVSSINDTASTPNEATNITGSFISWAKLPGGATALLYTDDGGTALDAHFPIDLRGLGQPTPGWAPFRIGAGSWENINQGFSSIIGFLESPNGGDINVGRVNARDNYGQIIFGWLKPSVTGKYIIAIAVDDNAELYLSTDDDPANSTLVASEPQWNGNRQYNDGGNDTTWTDPIDLVAGDEYYFELYMQEGGGGDNAAVAWTWTTDGSDPEVPANGSNPIPGENLVTFQPVQEEYTLNGTSPGDGSRGIAIGSDVTVKVTDGFSDIVDSASFSAMVGGNAVTIAATKDADGVTTATISGDQLADFMTGTEYTVKISFDASVSGSQSVEFTFKTAGPTPPHPDAYLSAEGLLNYWNFEGNANDIAGTIAGSSSSKADNGTPGDDISFTAEGGVEGAGQYALFPGTDDTLGTIEVGESDDILLAGKSLSISTWVRVDAFTTNWQAIIAQGEGRGYRLHRWGGNNGLAFKGGDGEPTGGNVNDGEWHSVIVTTESGGDTVLYIDGEEIGRGANGAGIENRDTGIGLLIGGNPQGGGRAWNGGIDEVAMWDRALTVDEVGLISLGQAAISDAQDKPVFTPPTTTPAEITGASTDGGNITFSFTGKLQSAPAATGPWTDVAGATSPFSEAMSDTSKFYRVVSE